MSNENRESVVELFDAVHGFMQIAGQTTGHFNARQACLYTGLQLEEMAEKIEAVMNGTITRQQRDHLFALVYTLQKYAKEFKEGMHEGDLLRATHADLIDADFDLAWVSIAGVISTARHPDAAIAHGTFTNLDKFRGGKALKDANGKVMKPADWQRPDFEPYTDKTPRL